MESTNETPVTCPVCGSTQIQLIVSNGQSYDVAGGLFAGLLGTLCLGPFGLLCALLGINDREVNEKLPRGCLNCGNRF